MQYIGIEIQETKKTARNMYGMPKPTCEYRARKYMFRTCIERRNDDGDWTILHSFQNREQRCMEILHRNK